MPKKSKFPKETEKYLRMLWENKTEAEKKRYIFNVALIIASRKKSNSKKGTE